MYGIDGFSRLEKNCQSIMMTKVTIGIQELKDLAS